MEPEIEMLVRERSASICAYAATVGGRVIRQCRSLYGCAVGTRKRRRGFRAREYTITEAKGHAKDFVVTEARLESKFANKIRRGVKGVGREKSTVEPAGGQ